MPQMTSLLRKDISFICSIPMVLFNILLLICIYRQVKFTYGKYKIVSKNMIKICLKYFTYNYSRCVCLQNWIVQF